MTTNGISFGDILRSEQTSRDTIPVRLVYVDMAGQDLIAGIALGKILRWYEERRQNGHNQHWVERDGHHWIAKQRTDWWDEARITPKQFDRAAGILSSKGLIVSKCYVFDGLRMMHIRLVPDRFLELWGQFAEPEPESDV